MFVQKSTSKASHHRIIGQPFYQSPSSLLTAGEALQKKRIIKSGRILQVGMLELVGDDGALRNKFFS